MNRAFQIAIAVLLLATPAAAQLPSQGSEGWHLNGALGFSFNSTNQTTLPATPGASSSSNYDTTAGDLRLNLSGFYKDPLLLPFTANFEGNGGDNSLTVGSYSNTVFSGGFNAVFLPAGPAPVRVYYQRNDYTANGSLFGQTSNTSNLGLNWTVRKTHIPRIVVDFLRYTNEVTFPTSVFATNFHQDQFEVTADDTWKGWEWSGGYGYYDSSSNFAGFLSLPSNYQEHLEVASGRLHRKFWDGKAEFYVNDRSQWQSSTFPGFGTTTASDSYTESRLTVQHTKKLSSTYFYDFTHVSMGPSALPVTGITLPGTVSVLTVPAFNSNYLGAKVSYQWKPTLRVFQEVRYQHVTPPSTQFQYQESLAESFSGVGYQKTWHGLDVNGVYTGHFQVMGTNLGSHTSTFSNDLFGRLAWGDVSKVRLSVSGEYSKLNLVQLLNGFSQNDYVRGQLETKRWNSFLFSIFGSYNNIELLNLSGDVRQSGTGYGVQVEHPRLGLSFSHTLQNGSGALFPIETQTTIQISDSLPLNLLLATPLLNSADHVTIGLATLRPRRNLEITGEYRNEKDVLTATSFQYRVLDGRLRYQVGKIHLEGGYGQYKNLSFGVPSFSGLKASLAFVRVYRYFKAF